MKALVATIDGCLRKDADPVCLAITPHLRINNNNIVLDYHLNIRSQLIIMM